jgi:hypothetical protein
VLFSNYSFNGQEKDDEVYGDGNAMTAEYWQYDARLGRRWNLDPEAQITMSDYACFGNNPITNTDILGNRFNRKGEKEAQKLEKGAKDRIASEQKDVDAAKAEIAKIQDLISSNTDATKTDEYNITISELESVVSNKEAVIKDLNSAISELGLMRESEQLFVFKNTYEGYGGETTYRRFRNAVVMRTDGELSSSAHEFKHGFQFIAGETSFKKGSGDVGKLGDLHDEQAAYRRQLAFDPYSFDRSNITFDDITTIKVKNQVDPDTGRKPYFNFPNQNRTIFNYRAGGLKNDVYVPAIKTVKIP